MTVIEIKVRLLAHCRLVTATWHISLNALIVHIATTHKCIFTRQLRVRLESISNAFAMTTTLILSLRST